MKFGILNHNNASQIFFTDSESAVMNIGDYVQSYGVENAYRECGIAEKDIVYCEKHGLNQINRADKICIVMNNVYSGYGVEGPLNSFPTPQFVVPIFIGFNCHDETLIKEQAEYFKKWQPIGCRDEKTRNIFRMQGIEAFLTGCSSILFPRRKEEVKRNKIYCVDIEDGIKEYLPQNYMAHLVMKTQNLDLKKYKNKMNDNMFFYKLGKKMLAEYSDNAKMVITSKLHCVAPCMAMGIPVVLAKNNIDFRFGWIDKFIPLYSKEDYNDIDWKGTKADVEYAKKLLMNVYREEINNHINKWEKPSHDAMNIIDKYYSNRIKTDYNRGIVNKLLDIIKSKRKHSLKVVIWGAGRTGGVIFDIIKNKKIDMEVKFFVDKFRTGFFKGKEIKAIDAFYDDSIDIYLLCSLPGRKEAVFNMKKFGLVENRDYVQVYLETEKLGG